MFLGCSSLSLGRAAGRQRPRQLFLLKPLTVLSEKKGDNQVTPATAQPFRIDALSLPLAGLI